MTRLRWFSFRKVRVPAVAHVWINQNQLESEFLLTAGHDTSLLVSLPEFPICLLTKMEAPSGREATLILLVSGTGLLRGRAGVKQVLCRCRGSSRSFQWALYKQHRF